MNSKKRKDNESKFDFWKEAENGNRIYWFEIKGKYDWKAKYVKEVDAEERTISFYQEIYNEKNELVEVHYKYPEDKGHQKLK